MRPVVSNIRKRKQSISVFRGINRSVNTAMSRVSSKNSSLFMEFKNTKNVTLDDYPAIRTRDERLYFYDDNKVISNLLATDKGLVRFCIDGKLYVGETAITPEPPYAWVAGEHKLIEYGNFVVVLPEKLIVNLIDNTVKCMQNHFISNASADLAVTVLNTSIEPSGNVYIDFINNKFEDINNEENQKTGALWCTWFDKFRLGDIVEDKGTVPSTVYLVTEIKEDDTGEAFKNYQSGRRVVFARIDDVYTKITCEGIGKGFVVGDFVRVEFSSGGFSLEEEKALLDNSYELFEVGDNYIVINCRLEQSQEYSGVIKIIRSLPCEMDFMIACNNRLWGCNSETNTVYASKLGDPTNWEAYGAGIASDSYFAELGSEGEFTGIAAAESSVYFFKENCIHRFYGTKPSNFTLTTYLDQGVRKGSGKSIVWLKDRLFYHSPSGVCVYLPGGEPQLISQDAFADVTYTESVAGKHGSKYVISLKREDGESELFVYDSDKGLWVLEGNEWLSSMTSYRDVLYFRLGDTNYIGCMRDTADSLLRLEESKELLKEGDLQWFLESGDLYDAYNEHKYIQRLDIIMETDTGEVSVWISKDGKPFEEIKKQYVSRKQNINIPLYPGRCQNFRIRLEGRGKVYLYGITLTTEEGSCNYGRI